MNAPGAGNMQRQSRPPPIIPYLPHSGIAPESPTNYGPNGKRWNDIQTATAPRTSGLTTQTTYPADNFFQLQNQSVDSHPRLQIVHLKTGSSEKKRNAGRPTQRSKKKRKMGDLGAPADQSQPTRPPSGGSQIGPQAGNSQQTLASRP